MGRFFRFVASLLFLPFALAITTSAETKLQAKSAILFIADGMGLAMITAARIYDRGVSGQLHIDLFPKTAIVKTHSSDNIVTDSGAAATAIATGVKTNNNVIGEDKTAIFKRRHGKRLTTIVDLAVKAGKSVGLVTTRRVTNTTPAAFYSHHHNKFAELAIAGQFVDDELRPHVLLGGGRRFWLPSKGGRNLLQELKVKGYTYVDSKKDLEKVKSKNTEKLIGLFSMDDMSYELDRNSVDSTQPTLAEMTSTAIEVLGKNPSGYFLMVEGGRIDQAAHNNDVLRTITDILAFDEAVGVAMKAVDVKQTLLLMTSDHETGGFTVSGSAPVDTKGKALLGKSPMGRIKGYPMVNWASGPGRQRRPVGKIKSQEHLSHSLIPSRLSEHTAVDVILAGMGPGSQKVHGFLDNTEIFTIIKAALNI